MKYLLVHLAFATFALVCDGAESKIDLDVSDAFTQERCHAIVDKAVAASPLTQESSMSICHEVSSKDSCSLLSEMLSLAYAKGGFDTDSFCQSMSDAHACSASMDQFLSSEVVTDLAVGHCLRSRPAKSEEYCQHFKGVLSALKVSDTVDTLRQCYMIELAQTKQQGPSVQATALVASSLPLGSLAGSQAAADQVQAAQPAVQAQVVQPAQQAVQPAQQAVQLAQQPAQPTQQAVQPAQQAAQPAQQVAQAAQQVVQPAPQAVVQLASTAQVQASQPTQVQATVQSAAQMQTAQVQPAAQIQPHLPLQSLTEQVPAVQAGVAAAPAAQVQLQQAQVSQQVQAAQAVAQPQAQQAQVVQGTQLQAAVQLQKAAQTEQASQQAQQTQEASQQAQPKQQASQQVQTQQASQPVTQQASHPAAQQAQQVQQLQPAAQPAAAKPAEDDHRLKLHSVLGQVESAAVAQAGSPASLNSMSQLEVAAATVTQATARSNANATAEVSANVNASGEMNASRKEYTGFLSKFVTG